MQGELHGLAATDALNNQMQTGQMDAPTLVGAVKDSGAIDVSLKEGERDDHATFADYKAHSKKFRPGFDN